MSTKPIKSTDTSNLPVLNVCTCGVPEDSPNDACAKHRLGVVWSKIGPIDVELIEAKKITSAEEALALCLAIIDPMHMGANPSEVQEAVDWPVVILELQYIAAMATNLADRYEKQTERNSGERIQPSFDEFKAYVQKGGDDAHTNKELIAKLSALPENSKIVFKFHQDAVRNLSAQLDKQGHSPICWLDGISEVLRGNECDAKDDEIVIVVQAN